MANVDTGSAWVVVVEDDDLVRNYLQRVVESAGMTCACVGTAAEATAALRTSGKPPLAVLIDGLLPDMHGAELARQILEEPQWAATGICFVSGALRDTPTFSAGIDALVKPIHHDDLMACLVRMKEWSEAGGSDLQTRTAVLTLITEKFMIAP
jgi:CheY-like chemotaxis protein